jgi:hypothetical protein
MTVEVKNLFVNVWLDVFGFDLVAIKINRPRSGLPCASGPALEPFSSNASRKRTAVVKLLHIVKVFVKMKK